MSNKISIAFASGKGGTGKTSLAVNFAKWLSRSVSVSLADLDVEEPNTGVYFRSTRNLKFQEESYVPIPEINESLCDHCGICASKCNLNAISITKNSSQIFNELCKGCGLCQMVCPKNAIQMKKTKIGVINQYLDDNLHLIEGVLDMGNIHTKPLIEMTKRKLDQHFNILDCPPGTTCPMVESVIDANFVVLVTEPTLFGLHDLDLAVETVKKLGKKFGVIINKSGDEDTLITNYCNSISCKVLGKIPLKKEYAIRCGKGELYYEDPLISSELQSVYEEILEELK